MVSLVLLFVDEPFKFCHMVECKYTQSQAAGLKPATLSAHAEMKRQKTHDKTVH